jgi:hypothetical protein
MVWTKFSYTVNSKVRPAFDAAFGQPEQNDALAPLIKKQKTDAGSTEKNHNVLGAIQSGPHCNNRMNGVKHINI